MKSMSERRIYAAFLCLLFSGLASCTVGPDFTPPEASLPAQWENSVVQTANAGELKEWWRQFQDSTLDALVSTALDQNLDRDKASARIRQARAGRDATAASWWPQISAGGQYRRTGRAGGSDNVTGIDTGAGTIRQANGNGSDSFQAGFDASWELDIFGGTRREVEAADAEAQATVEDERNVQLTLISEVASRYASLRGLQQRLAVANANLEIQRQSASIALRRFDAGFASSLDTAQAQAEVATTMAQIPSIESAVRQEMHALALLLALHPSSLYSLLGPERSIPKTEQSLPIGFPFELLERRPDVRRAEAALHAANARIGAAIADWYPKLSLSGLFSLEGDRFDALSYWDNHIWNLGSSVFLPLIDGGRIRANVRLQDARQEEAFADYEQTVLIALQEVENALVSYQKEKERSQALARAVEENRKALAAAKSLYAEGVNDFLSVASSERALFSSEDALTQSSVTQTLNLIALYKSLGGGWSETP